MAFRRRSGSSRGPSTRALSIRKANKRRTWETSYLSFCDMATFQWVNPGESGCFNQTALDIVPANLVKTVFSDSVKIKRIVGNLWVRPVFNLDAAQDFCEEAALIQLLGLFHGVFWAGWRRYEQTSQDPIGPDLRPLESPDDFSDAHWIDTYEHMWWPSLEGQDFAYPPDALIGVCSDVQGSGGGGGANAAVNGTTWTATEGAIDTEIDPIDITTTCTPMLNGGPCTQGQTSLLTRMPSAHKIVLDKRFKKGITLKENYGLQLYTSYGPLTDSMFHIPLPAWNNVFVGFDYYANIKVKYEY